MPQNSGAGLSSSADTSLKHSVLFAQKSPGVPWPRAEPVGSPRTSSPFRGVVVNGLKSPQGQGLNRYFRPVGVYWG